MESKKTAHAFHAYTQLPQVEKPLEDLFLHIITFELPKEAKEWIVKYSPYIALILGVLLLPVILGVFGLASFVGVWGSAIGVVGPWYWLTLGIAAVEIVLYFMAYGYLVKKDKYGWALLWYSSALSLVSGVVGGLNLGTLLGAAVGFYVLYQIKYLYK